MTAKDKAKDLVEKFSNECLLTVTGGKVAALIAIDEIIEECYKWSGEFSNDTWDRERFNFFTDVKREIENLIEAQNY